MPPLIFAAAASSCRFISPLRCRFIFDAAAITPPLRPSAMRDAADGAADAMPMLLPTRAPRCRCLRFDATLMAADADFRQRRCLFMPRASYV